MTTISQQGSKGADNLIHPWKLQFFNLLKKISWVSKLASFSQLQIYFSKLRTREISDQEVIEKVPLVAHTQQLCSPDNTVNTERVECMEFP